MTDDEQLKQKKQRLDSLSQTPSCSSELTVAKPVEDVKSEELQTFFPSILKSWVRIYNSMESSKDCKTDMKNMCNITNTSCLPRNELVAGEVIKAINIMYILSLMEHNPEFFELFELSERDKSNATQPPRFNFKMLTDLNNDEYNSGIARICSQLCYMVYYKSADTVFELKYNGKMILSVVVILPLSTFRENDLEESYVSFEKRMYMQLFGKYGPKYVIGDLHKVIYRDLHEELIAKAWHPDRVENWCFDEDDLAIQAQFANELCT